MNKLVFIFGTIAGIIVSLMVFFSTYDGGVNLENGELIGYATMVIAFSTIFFAVRSYRDKYLDGQIKFVKAFLVGLYITLVASTIYVGSWMVFVNTFASDFMDNYHNQAVIEINKSDLSQEEKDLQIKEMEEFKEAYKNPLVKIVVTYSEILPVGLIISLISALLLRRSELELEQES